MLARALSGVGGETDYSYSIVRAFSKSGTPATETITVDASKRYFILSTPPANYTSALNRFDMYFYRDGVLTKKLGGAGDSDIVKTNDTTLTYTVNSSIAHLVTVMEEVTI